MVLFGFFRITVQVTTYKKMKTYHKAVGLHRVCNYTYMAIATAVRLSLGFYCISGSVTKNKI